MNHHKWPLILSEVKLHDQIATTKRIQSRYVNHHNISNCWRTLHYFPMNIIDRLISVSTSFIFLPCKFNRTLPYIQIKLFSSVRSTFHGQIQFNHQFLANIIPLLSFFTTHYKNNCLTSHLSPTNTITLLLLY